MTVNLYKLETLIIDDLQEAAQWARDNGDDFTRDDFDRTVNETIDRALIYTHDIISLWDDLRNPEPYTMLDTISASILHAVIEAIYESDVITNAAIETGLESVYSA